MAKGCMAVPWGHLLDDTKLSLFQGVWFQSLTVDVNNLCSVYDILCQSSLWSMKQILVIKRRFRLLCSQSPTFRA